MNDPAKLYFKKMPMSRLRNML